MEKYRIKLNGEIYEVEIENITEDKSIASSSSSITSQENKRESIEKIMKAPMKGNIVNVKVKIGDMIKKGQVLLILEAMKMEMEIVAPVDGKIESISVGKGDAVNPGDVLLQIA
jgi:biotin carboxyl carrier protein